MTLGGFCSNATYWNSGKLLQVSINAEQSNSEAHCAGMEVLMAKVIKTGKCCECGEVFPMEELERCPVCDGLVCNDCLNEHEESCSEDEE